MQFRTLLRVMLLLVVAMFATASRATLPKFDTMFVFGDSLSDTGNVMLATRQQGLVPAIPPSDSPYATYYQGRFSNGPVAVESLWKAVSLNKLATVRPFLLDRSIPKRGAVNFAFGGAATGASNATPGGFIVPGVLGQVGLFSAALGNKPAPANALYVVWAGGNDYGATGQTSPGPVVANIAQAIRTLHALGARKFLVPNLPDLGLSPMAQAQGQGAALTQLTKAHNNLLAQTLRNLSSSLHRVSIVQADIYKVGEVLVSTGVVSVSPPALEMIAPGTGAVDCLFRNTATCIDVPLDAPLPPVLFWDILHPTAQVHDVMAMTMYTRLLLSRISD
ncbi:SGNH/GDSL hydrolase family protein [Aquincola sp. MAHUQ-54]|uniref:SGNH/GDSL hydrolase family protein n=1 Tax=Aquincola agrisoli TaxID=3119538 RepID=A0AAW9PY57_9BURK